MWRHIAADNARAARRVREEIQSPRHRPDLTNPLLRSFYLAAYHCLVQISSVIELQGTLTIEELTRFQYFHTLRRTWPIVLVLALVVIVVFPIVGLAALASSESDWRTVLTNFAPLILLSLFWLLAMCVLPYRNARKLFATQSFLREPIVYTFTPEKFSGTGQNASWNLAWSVLKNVRETKSLFLLYHHPNFAVVVPKRFFPNEAEMTEWRQLVSTSAAPRQIESPGIVGRWC